MQAHLQLGVFVVGLAPLFAQAVHYELRVADPATRQAEVHATFPTAGSAELVLFLPTWSPGYYVRQDHAAQVLTFSASADGKELAVDKPSPNRWRMPTGGAASITVTYTLRCQRGSVTENQITADFAVFCGPATFVGEVGRLDRPITLAVSAPAMWPDVATGLPRGKDGLWTARDHDLLLDSPLVLGKVATTAFDVHGVRHEWAQVGDHGNFATAALVPTLAHTCEQVCAAFGDVPFARYAFLATFRRANGGLEHLDSTLVSMHAKQRHDDPGTLSFLAHEYTHAFNVKRLRPAGLGPFDYENPPRTPSLWVSEGLTTWLGDLALVRAGAIDRTAWLGLVSEHVRGLQGAAGRKRQTLADASLAVWDTSTSGVGGDPRTTISYYVKGPVVGFVLEARLRSASGGKHGLDELMRRAYGRWSGAMGFTPAEFEALATEVAGTDLRPFFDLALRSTEELDYREALDWFGLEFTPVAEDAPRAQRWALRPRAGAAPDAAARLGALLAPLPAPTKPR
ncbi:MAG: M61 family metallopeptidase [Planctomycetes bacterium]|nr:M61 family metallopeptidase [Planctomycetota bacterium]